MVNFLKNKVSETDDIKEKEDEDLELEFDMN
jgi:fructose-specific PTS system IIC-like component